MRHDSCRLGTHFVADFSSDISPSDPSKKNIEDLVDQSGQRTDVSVSHVLNIYIYIYIHNYICIYIFIDPSIISICYKIYNITIQYIIHIHHYSPISKDPHLHLQATLLVQLLPLSNRLGRGHLGHCGVAPDQPHWLGGHRGDVPCWRRHGGETWSQK